MKKNILNGLTAFCVSMTLLVACSKTALNTKEANPGSEVHSHQSKPPSQNPVEIVSLALTGSVDYGKISLDDIVNYHNEAMIYVVDQVKESGLCPEDNEIFRNQFEAYLEAFLQTKGISAELQINSILGLMDEEDLPLYDQGMNLSPEAVKLCNRIEYVFDAYADDSISSHVFSDSITAIVNDAGVLDNPYERITIQLTAKIAEGSSFFWQEYYTSLKSEALSNCANQSNSQLKAKLNWGSVAFSDARGAIQGGTWGAAAAGGVPEAIAGGLAGAGARSAVSIIKQAITNR